MAEIAENLHRRELGEIERAELMARWVEITAAKQDAKEAAAKAQADQSRQVGAIESKRADGKGHRKQGGIKQAAREIGVPEQTVRRAVKIAALAPEAKKLAKRLKAPQAVLLEAAKHDVADDQVAVIRGRMQESAVKIAALSPVLEHPHFGKKVRWSRVAKLSQEVTITIPFVEESARGCNIGLALRELAFRARGTEWLTTHAKQPKQSPSSL
ncbi:hypothetical protein H9N28_07215 [Rhodobacter capsulatus]|uniref:Uncharacterized protein n=1 Tax=Rhodobacter capsulatus TaxID=1061 RepID=A0A1G7GZJ3_RHOCA|nr:hypothetical protein [Rhodobacter capsulatus]PZX27533.1 hypothetical protein LY44_00909 [Rhodobacter capsulatus]QNR64602.1 hypothetical protein H9N28_07215 [Rhodobacter capsulatus]WER07596.1 hypothetical protein PUH89_09545 [Rhodobacter capsulatus]SDE93578.1 hypothetical protein SAMN04244550_01350 [Rhodobacter capsulatus]